MGAIRRAGTAYLSEHLCLHHGFFCGARVAQA